MVLKGMYTIWLLSISLKSQPPNISSSQQARLHSDSPSFKADMDISRTIDALYYAFAVGLVIFGMSVSQAWIYMHNNHDRWSLRFLVLLLVILDIAETSCILVTLHGYLIVNFGNVESLNHLEHTLSIAILITGFTFFFVHMFFATRLYILSKTWWIPSIIACLSTTMLVINIYTTTISYSELFTSRSTTLKTEIAIYHTLAVVTDIIVTLSFIWQLSRLKTMFKATGKLLHRLFVYSITRGLLMAPVQVAHLIMFFIKPVDVLFWVSLHIVLSNLYIITMLVMLNSRPSAQNKDSTTDSLNFAHTDGLISVRNGNSGDRSQETLTV